MLVVLAVVVALALRLPVGSVPPGLYHDEAWYGLDAVDVLAGRPALYFTANHGREPLFIYLVAGAIALLGQSPAAVRLVSALIGTVLVAATFAGVQALAGRRVGLGAAWLCAVTPWPVLLGRVGFRATTLPLVLALCIAATWRAHRSPHGPWLLLGGGLAGLTLYTYTAARLVPLFFVLAALWLWARGWRPDRRRAMLWLLAAGVVALPLVAYWAAHPDDFLARAGEVAVTRPGDGGEPAVSVLARNALATLGMFTVRGDFIARHNIPLRPVFGWLAGSLALLGVAWALWRARRRPTLGVLLAWGGVLALPTLLAEGAPHFLRAVGLLPVTMALPMLGLEAVRVISGKFSARRPATLVAVLAAAVVLAELGATVGYLRAAAGGETAALLDVRFEGGATTLAREVNTVLGTGWRGGWTVAPTTAGQRVWLDRRLRDGWAAVPFLVPIERLTLVDRYDPILGDGPGMAFLLPDRLEPDGLWSKLAPNLRLSFTNGALAAGDLDPVPKRMWVRVDGVPAVPVAAPVARFANGLQLLEADVQPGVDGGLDVATVWSTEAATGSDVTAFVQVLEDGRRVAGADAPLGAGLFPTPRWRPGDQIVEQYHIDVPGGYDPARHSLIAGTYVAPEAARVDVVDASGAPIDDHVVLDGR
jgi:4-amino-4-deoxy-L-arabinose transferase-like glycosyltransferase